MYGTADVCGAQGAEVRKPSGADRIALVSGLMIEGGIGEVNGLAP
jgi:hypothetical protein